MFTSPPLLVPCLLSTHLNIWPVCGHAGPTVVLPPFEIFLLVDGHQRLVQFTVHCFHTGTGKESQGHFSYTLTCRAAAHLSLFVTSKCLWMERNACFRKLILFLSSSCDCSKMASISSIYRGVYDVTSSSTFSYRSLVCRQLTKTVFP